MAYARRLFRLRRGMQSKGQALLEYITLLGIFVVVLYVFMKFGSALAKGFNSIAVHVARMAP
jgi:hypothetical protein